MIIDNRTPLFTIVTIGYNVSSVVGQTIHSICSQDAIYPFEFIFVDDFSQDNTIEVVKKQVADDRCNHITYKIIANDKNIGPNNSRNVGVLAATTEFILLCDGDDVLDKNWSTRLVDKLLSGAHFVCGRLEEFGTDRKSGQPRALVTIGASSGPAVPTCGGGNMGFTKSAYLKAGGMPVDFPVLAFGRRPASEDTCFCWLMHHAKVQLVHVPEAILYYRQRKQLVSTIIQQYCFGMGAVIVERIFISQRQPIIDISRDVFYVVVGIVFCIPLVMRNGIHDWIGRMSRRLGRIDCFIRLTYMSSLKECIASIEAHKHVVISDTL